VAGEGDDEHSLLRLAEEDLIRSHPLLAHRNLGDIDRDTDVAARRHLGG
jgi:hypothetical protein